jgi:hypothetical protein
VNYPGSASSADAVPNDGFVSSRLVGSNYNLQITINDSPETVLIDLDEVRITPNTDYFFALIGTTESIQVVSATTDLAQPTTAAASPTVSSSNDDSAHLRVAHFSSGTPEIDVYINGELSEFGSLGFGEITSFVDLEPGTYSLAIAPAGRTFAEAVIGPIELTLDAGDWFTGALIGTLTNNTLGLHLLEEDFSPLADTDTRLSVFHGFPTIDAIDVRLSDGTLLLQLLAYPGAQGNNDGLSSIDLPLGTYDIQVVEASNPEEVLIELRGTRLLAGRHYFLAVIRAEPPYVFTFTEIPQPE